MIHGCDTARIGRAIRQFGHAVFHNHTVFGAYGAEIAFLYVGSRRTHGIGNQKNTIRPLEPDNHLHQLFRDMPAVAYQVNRHIVKQHGRFGNARISDLVDLAHPGR